ALLAGLLPVTNRPSTSTGIVKSMVTEEELELAVKANWPRPRRAKAVQIASRSAPPLRALSAAMIASRAWVNEGLAGWIFMASMTSRRASLLPACPGPAVEGHPVARLGSNPYLLIKGQFMSHKADAQISAVLWTSCAGSLLKAANVIGSMVVLKLYFCRRIPCPVCGWPRT